MKRDYTVDSLYRNSKKFKPLTILGIFLVILIILGVLFSFVKVYRAANALANREAEPFPDVAENTMPIHSTTSFFSLDQSLKLEGWFFKKNTDEFRGNVMFVHNNRENRVQFDLETAELFSNLMASGFNIYAFDLRHSGRSAGSIATYGYAEYQDVLMAMNHIYTLTGEKSFVLYGVGSGTASSILAFHALDSEQSTNNSKSQLSSQVGVYKEDIIGMVLDTPTSSPDDYIRSDLPNQNLFDRLIFSKYVPAAIKAISGYAGDSNLIPMLTQFTSPVLITRNLPNTRIDSYAIDSIIDERIRLHPSTTSVFETPIPGHLDGYNLDRENYLKQLNKFLDVWFPNLYAEDSEE